MNLGAIYLMYQFFLNFSSFSRFTCIFSGVHLSSVSRKEHGHIPYIFIFVSVGFGMNLSLKVMRKYFMSTQKKYVNLYHLGFCSKYCLKGGSVAS